MGEHVHLYFLYNVTGTPSFICIIFRYIVGTTDFNLLIFNDICTSGTKLENYL